MSKQSICIIFVAVINMLMVSACKHPTNAGPDGDARNLTVGTVQREIKVGMSGAEIVAALGSPNIVTTDEKRREVWVYDKVSSSRVDTANSIGGSIIIFGGSSAQSESTSTQKTLTIIIKYDEQKMVRDFAYNYTQF